MAQDKLDQVSPELRAYVATIREHAYRVTDEQVAELRQAGWTDDQLYELTLAVAVGAGARRLRAGLDALDRVEGAKS